MTHVNVNDNAKAVRRGEQAKRQAAVALTFVSVVALARRAIPSAARTAHDSQHERQRTHDPLEYVTLEPEHEKQLQMSHERNPHEHRLELAHRKPHESMVKPVAKLLSSCRLRAWLRAAVWPG